MIVLEDTHWPLVVIGDCHGACCDAPAFCRARARWQSCEPRLAVFVVPGQGLQALASLDALVRWLRRQPIESALCRVAAWVIPDNEVRSTVAALLEAHDDRTFGGVSATFHDVGSALTWIRTASA